MPLVTVAAHYDGSRVLLDEAIDLRPNTRLMVTILEERDQEYGEFLSMASRALGSALADDEVEYFRKQTWCDEMWSHCIDPCFVD